MKFVKILHYVEKSYDDKPSFVILMDDNKEYISNGCVWIENTPSNISVLIENYDCKGYIEELLQAPALEIEDLVDGGYMFDGSELTEWDLELPELVTGILMFRDTRLTEWAIELPKLEDGRFMFSGTNITEWSIGLPELVTGFGMFTDVGLTKWSGELPKLEDGFFYLPVDRPYRMAYRVT